jgi:hypothetical protein
MPNYDYLKFVEMDADLADEVDEYLKKNRLKPMRFMVVFDELGRMSAWARRDIHLATFELPVKVPAAAKLVDQSMMTLGIYELEGGEVFSAWCRNQKYWLAAPKNVARHAVREVPPTKRPARTAKKPTIKKVP